MNIPALFRKRFIPDEMIELKDDIVCFRSSDMLITRWKSLKPRPDIAGGTSLYLPEKNWKISRIHDAAGCPLHHYCDIIHTDYNKEKDTYIFTDLLADIVVQTDGTYSVLDLDELADALSQSLIDPVLLCTALRAADALIKVIESGGFGAYARLLEPYAENPGKR